MKKHEFFDICNKAVYGDSEGGYMTLRVEACGDPLTSIGAGNAGIYLLGHFRGLSHRTVYSPQQKYGPTKRAWQLVEREIPKYKRWLDEWMKEHPPATSIELCERCNGPAVINDEDVFCWCNNAQSTQEESDVHP